MFNIGDVAIRKEYDGMVDQSVVMVVVDTPYGFVKGVVIGSKGGANANAIGNKYVASEDELSHITDEQVDLLLERDGEYRWIGTPSDIWRLISDVRFGIEGGEECRTPIWKPDTERRFQWDGEVAFYGDRVETLLHGYGYDTSSHAVKKIVRGSINAKTPIENLFLKSEDYDPKTRQIVFTEEFDRVFDTGVLRKFCSLCMEWVNREGERKQKRYFASGLTKMEVQSRVDQIERTVSALQKVSHHLYALHESVEALGGNENLEVDATSDFHRLFREFTHSLRKYENGIKMAVQSNDTQSGMCLPNNTEVMLPTEDKRRLKGFVKFIKEVCEMTDAAISKSQVEKFEFWYDEVKTGNGNLNCSTQSKLSRIIQKFCKEVGMKDDPQDWYDWNKEYAKLADAINPKKLKHKCVLSINPIDFYTMSFGNTWGSCHTIDKTNLRDIDFRNGYHGCYSSGTESYMLDGTSFVFYTVDPKTETGFENRDKILRCMFHMGEDKIVQGRLYPQSMDGNGWLLYDQIRKAVVDRILKLVSDTEIKTENQSGINHTNNSIRARGTHYRDYLNFAMCNVTWLLSPNGMKNTDFMEVGHNPICPCCGREHEYEENILCEDCVGDGCYEYGDVIEE